MRVEDVFNSKPQRMPQFLPPEASVSDAIRMMADQHVGCIVVSRDGRKVRGMLSATEIIDSIAAMGMVCLIEPIELIMREDFATCRMQDPIGLALSRMVKGGRRHIPIMERGILQGVLSMGDTARARVAYLESCLGVKEYAEPDVDEMYGVQRPAQQVHMT
jgi:CBS domain-containing protein